MAHWAMAICARESEGEYSVYKDTKRTLNNGSQLSWRFPSVGGAKLFLLSSCWLLQSTSCNELLSSAHAKVAGARFSNTQSICVYTFGSTLISVGLVLCPTLLPSSSLLASLLHNQEALNHLDFFFSWLLKWNSLAIVSKCAVWLIKSCCWQHRPAVPEETNV